MRLLPKTVIESEEYWQSIKGYNKWFIELRKYAVVSLVLMMVVIQFVLGIGLTDIQFYGIAFTAVMIFCYNLFFQSIQKKIENNEKSILNSLELSFLQILLDLISLSIVVYLTGGIEAPIFLFFIFHMIIGSLLLPEKVIYTVAVLLIGSFSTFSLLEYYQIIPHMELNGLFKNPIYNDINFVAGFLGIFSFSILISIKLTSKITQELYSRERQLKLALQEINQAEESKQKYIMAVVHELKSPIVAATSQLELVNGGYVGEVPDAVKSKTVKAKDRLAESIENINNILHVSKFKLLNQIEKSDVDLGELIDEIVETNSPYAEKKKIKLTYDNRLKDKLITADKLLLKLAVSNLVSNSVKYTPEIGTVKVTTFDSEDKIDISIEDDGIGIPKKDQDKIFEDFYRASNLKGKRIEGTGTGLSIVKQIIESHSGNISLESPSTLSKEGRPGTKFTITLKKEYL
jgi:signal transduction histidine kinase